jgi:hypothetical protein
MTDQGNRPALVSDLDVEPKQEWYSPDQILCEEAGEIHGQPFMAEGKELYKKLHAVHSTALCLSGGGVRSASFNVGVIEALAANPRTPAASGEEGDAQVDAPGKSLLAQFKYLSTVSGGGYVGSWLSAWIARDGYAKVWPKLVGRRQYSEVEPQELVWLRSYSNFLTPRVGLFSADTWAGVALVLRNLVLNWLVIVPVLCLVLFSIKGLGVAAFLLSDPPRFALIGFAIGAALLLVVALRFPLVNRPSCNPGVVVRGQPIGQPAENWLWTSLRAASCCLLGCPPKKRIVKRKFDGSLDVPQSELVEIQQPGTLGPQHNEKQRVTAGGNESRFLWRCLLPAIGSALLLSLYLTSRYVALETKPLWWTVLVAVGVGLGIYALTWIIARCQIALCGDPNNDPERRKNKWGADFIAWLAAGVVYGAFVGVGIHMLATTIGEDQLDFFSEQSSAAGIEVTPDTLRSLVLLIIGMPWIVTAQLTAEMIFVGLTSYMPNSDEDREWFGRSTGWFTAVAIGWVCATFLVLIGPPLASYVFATFPWAKYGTTALGALSAAVGTYLGKSGKSSATDQGKQSDPRWVRYAMPVATVTFLILLVVGVSAAMDSLLFNHVLVVSPLLTTVDYTDIWHDLGWFLGGATIVFAIASLASHMVNINRFSIHSLYRNRLIRAYLGASNHDRAPNPFTGFDEVDNKPMAALWRRKPQPGAQPDAGQQSKTEGEAKREEKSKTDEKRPADDWQPFHIVNIALNVVSSKRLAWQERKAESFTVSPLHCGTAANGLGYRPTKRYAHIRHGLTLGTAMAISGAAASPNMGYNSSPLVTLLLALFNVRLGWWLGNPGQKAGKDTYKLEGPAKAMKPFLFEMFGRTTDTWEYVYLSDGGHFENLGLYEMIRRRCRCIVVSDAGCDPNYQFTDLGNATRKIAIDLGVYISFSELRKIKRRSSDNSVIDGAYYAIGEIDYKTAPEHTPDPMATEGQARGLVKNRAAVKNGYVLYIKPSYHGTESAGIVSYAAANAQFPHESTGDLFYGESQFESYRTLGFEIVDGVLKQARANVEKINKSGAAKLDSGSLCGLIEALRPDLIKKAEDASHPAPGSFVQQIVGALTGDAAAELRGALGGSPKDAAEKRLSPDQVDAPKASRPTRPRLPRARSPE